MENLDLLKQQRYELAKAAMQGIISNSLIIEGMLDNDCDLSSAIAFDAVLYADAVIKRLDEVELLPNKS